MKNRLLLSIALFLGLGLSSVFAQEWSPAQKEVWKNVNTYWEIMAKGDVNGFMEYFHADYAGWENGEPLPSTKEETRKWLSYGSAQGKVLIFDIKPVAIKIHGDVAIVDYFYTMVKENKEGKKNPDAGRWTDILLKQGTKWVLIGDHGGRDKKE